MERKIPEAYQLSALDQGDQTWVPDFLRQRWGDIIMITRGKAHDLTLHPGFAVWDGDEVVGLVTYRVSDGECEITSLDSIREGQGIGSALIEATLDHAKKIGSRRLWLITTNDNTHALRFYQKRGFTIVAVHVRAIDRVTRLLKPGIPFTGHDGIPLRDEIELEIPIELSQSTDILGNIEFPTRLSRQVLYSCPWLTLYKDRVKLPDGRILPDYHVVEFLNAVGVLVHNDQGEYLFERVYRYPTGRLEWEIPAGALEPGEDPIQAAIREVYEETGYETRDHKVLYNFFPNDGNTNQVYYLVICQAGAQTGGIDSGEIKECRWLNVDNIQVLIQDGELMDGLSLVGYFIAVQRKGYPN
jgi:8-oxo-dGTP pyrophosphatase MutT (NUDIX family)/GNAT superfamily N-acetyltransferase